MLASLRSLLPKDGSDHGGLWIPKIYQHLKVTINKTYLDTFSLFQNFFYDTISGELRCFQGSSELSSIFQQDSFQNSTDES